MPSTNSSCSRIEDLHNTRRRRSSTSSEALARSRKRPKMIAEINLLDDDDEISTTLQKQREEQVRSQAQPSSKALKMNNLTCTVCLDTPTDLTATSCGHTFCRNCLYDWLDTAATQRRQTCPTCRKTISKTKGKLDLIPLEIKLRQPAGSATKT